MKRHMADMTDAAAAGIILLYLVFIIGALVLVVAA